MSRRRPALGPSRHRPAVRAAVDTVLTAKATPVLGQLLVLGALLTAAACSGVGSGSVTADDPRAEPPTPASPTAPTGPVPLTVAQAGAALVTEADLGAPWTPTQGAATWRDGLLKATANAASPDCQRLLDALYADEILGEPSAPAAVVALDDPADRAQLRYQVAAHRAADVDRTLGWLRTLPRTCGRFTATTSRGGVQEVQVGEEQLPQVGDARQGLRVTLTGAGGGNAAAAGNAHPAGVDGAAGNGGSAGSGGNAGNGGAVDGNGDAVGNGVLTLDVAAVRLGGDAITVTTGGLGTVPPAATQTAVLLGAQHVTQARRQHPA